eukprot:CAMPEP_0180149466 /NCGR_PEP_ID=MMETSP0986-20121125/20815_1 /TAXON_ID=697907 /ORGANISM="non described non described, Strain CCMP2293" /LENGTH=38 /DNA_ID= /DNA_START= /DNA_END= /DNA_ORIENTATION=
MSHPLPPSPPNFTNPPRPLTWGARPRKTPMPYAVRHKP